MSGSVRPRKRVWWKGEANSSAIQSPMSPQKVESKGFVTLPKLSSRIVCCPRDWGWAGHWAEKVSLRRLQRQVCVESRTSALGTGDYLTTVLLTVP